MSKSQAKSKAKSQTKPQATSITFLLDRTGSMQSIKDDTIGAFNAYLDGLKGQTNIEFSLVQFDSMSLDKTCVRVPVAQVQPLTNDSYQPRASTPLIDAAYKTIKAVEASLNGKNPKVIICIQTDGQENCSVQYTWAQLNALIKEKSALGWQFNFMGAGIDAYQQGAAMGISTASTVSYSKDPRMTRATFAATASNHASFSAGLASNTNYSSMQKRASGDKHEPKRATPPVPTPAQPESPKAVDDFAL